MGNLAWVVLLGAAACSKKSNEAKPAPAPGAASAVAPVAIDAAVAAAPALDPSKLLDEITATKQPALVGPFKDIQLSETLVSADLPPDLCRSFATVRAWCQLDRGGVKFRVERIPTDADEGQFPVNTLRITLPAAGVKDKLVAAWGPPKTDRGEDFWFAPATHLRVALHKAEMKGDPDGLVDLDYSGYWTLDDFLGPDKKLFAFERGTPLLGAKPGELHRRYGGRYSDSAIHLWPLDTERSTTIQVGDQLDAAFESDAPNAVQGYSIVLGQPDDAVRAAMTRKFGKGHKSGDVTVYQAKPRVAVDADGSLQVGKVDDD